MYQDDQEGTFFFEPAFVGKVNSMNNHLYFIFQTGFSTPMVNKYFDHRGFQMSAGMGFRLGGVDAPVKQSRN